MGHGIHVQIDSSLQYAALSIYHFVTGQEAERQNQQGWWVHQGMQATWSHVMTSCHVTDTSLTGPQARNMDACHMIACHDIMPCHRHISGDPHTRNLDACHMVTCHDIMPCHIRDWSPGEKAVEALAGYERSTIGMFKSAAAKLIEEVGSAEDAVAMALAKITGLSTLRVRQKAFCRRRHRRSSQYMGIEG